MLKGSLVAIVAFTLHPVAGLSLTRHWSASQLIERDLANPARTFFRSGEGPPDNSATGTIGVFLKKHGAKSLGFVARDFAQEGPVYTVTTSPNHSTPLLVTLPSTKFNLLKYDFNIATSINEPDPAHPFLGAALIVDNLKKGNDGYAFLSGTTAGGASGPDILSTSKVPSLGESKIWKLDCKTHHFSIDWVNNDGSHFPATFFFFPRDQVQTNDEDGLGLYGDRVAVENANQVTLQDVVSSLSIKVTLLRLPPFALCERTSSSSLRTRARKFAHELSHWLAGNYACTRVLCGQAVCVSIVLTCPGDSQPLAATMTTVAAAETAITRAAQAANELASDFVETRSVTLDWKVTNLKQLFEGSKGDSKSKCVKSALFDSHRWQIFFYPNSGHEQYCSLYLSCEPTAAEKEKGLAERAGWGVNGSGAKGAGGKEGGKDVGGGGKDAKGPWKREGKFKFTFEARSLDRRMTFKQMEAHDHSFSDTARNWGYANFLKRSDAYFSNPSVRLADAFLIVCTIVYSPTPPSPPPLPRLLIPKDLVNAYASLFDDPDYSDVCFRIRPQDGKKRERRLYAAKKVLAGRSDYFDTMFSSGFNESSAQPVSLPSSPNQSAGDVEGDGDEIDYEEDDSEDEDWDEDDDSEVEPDDEDGESRRSGSQFSEIEELETTADSHHEQKASSSAASIVSSSEDEEDAHFVSGETEGEEEGEAKGDGQDGGSITTQSRRRMDSGSRRRTESDLSGSAPFVDAHSAPASPSRTPMPRKSPGDLTEKDGETARAGPPERDTKSTTPRKAAKKNDRPKRPMFEVVVTDAAYTSFRALIYYLYTDSITFSPLASNYHTARDLATQNGTLFPFPNRRSYLIATSIPTPHAMTASPSTPGPCGAKAIYRLADKIGLPELKERAYDHIVKSLTVQNIPYEVFGSFSLRFEEIKRVEIAFLLDKWNELRESSSLRKVFQFGLLRAGRFPGFEEVMVRILPNLEYRPPSTGEEERV
ncbi:hypothetical protein P7C70_g3460, partial [Phenoliferia sp. Uapishka_3]